MFNLFLTLFIGWTNSVRVLTANIDSNVLICASFYIFYFFIASVFSLSIVAGFLIDNFCDCFSDLIFTQL